jgi:hypothetical protein
MPSGSLQNVLVCVPATSATQAESAICPSIGGQVFQPAQVQAYLLDPSQQGSLEAVFEPFDYGYAAGVWSLAFTTVVGLYFVSHGIGLVLGMIRRG